MYTLLLGTGKNGLYTYQFLKRKNIFIKVYDDNHTNYEMFLTNEIYKYMDEIEWQKIVEIVCTPGIQHEHPILMHARSLCIPVLSNLDVLYKYGDKNNYYVGVTGSNGKTTTVLMISHLLKSKNIPHLLAGNIGEDIFMDIISYKEKKIYILEVSSYQLHYTNFMTFDIGGITNITNNHEKWHGSFTEYKNDKLKIYRLKEGDQSFFMGESLKEKFYNKNVINTYIKHKKILKYMQTQYSLHNIKNFLLAFIIVNKILPLSVEEALSFMKNFKFPLYRCEIIINNQNYIVINDSKSTSIASTNMAIKMAKIFEKKIFLIIGHEFKGAIETLQYKDIYQFYIFGNSRHIIINYLNKQSCKNFITFENLSSLMIYLKNNLQNGIYLFSPGGASFEEFKDFNERGAFFTEEILKIFN